jgi:hypothetical protein
MHLKLESLLNIQWIVRHYKLFENQVLFKFLHLLSRNQFGLIGVAVIDFI